MKTMKTALVLVMAILTTSIAYGGGNLKVDFESNDANMAILKVTNSQMSHFEFELSDAYGNRLYINTLDKPQSDYRKGYDLSKLDDGIYWYSVKIDNEKVVKKIELDNGVLEVLEKRKWLDPLYKLEDDILKLSFLNFQGDNIKLYVYDKNYNEILSDTKLGDNFAIHKALDFSDVENGDYTIVLANTTDLHRYNISID